MHSEINLLREVEAIQIPSGDTIKLPAGTRVIITQALGGTYTVATDHGLARIPAKDVDALGIDPAEEKKKTEQSYRSARLVYIAYVMMRNEICFLLFSVRQSEAEPFARALGPAHPLHRRVVDRTRRLPQQPPALVPRAQQRRPEWHSQIGVRNRRDDLRANRGTLVR